MEAKPSPGMSEQGQCHSEGGACPPGGIVS